MSEIAWAGLYVFGRGLRMILPHFLEPRWFRCIVVLLPVPQNRKRMWKYELGPMAVAALVASACGPHAHIPIRPVDLPSALAATDSAAVLARRLAPVLYLQRDETFPLERAVAVVHPTRRIIAYHLLWRDDVHGAWIPFTVPTDEEVLWVGYDSTKAPTDVWTYWHGRILHTPWNRSQVAVDVQWGKHGTLPRGIVESDLPKTATLNDFYALTIIGLPDILLGDIFRKGPLCFCHSFARYRDFSRTVLLSDHLDAVARTNDPRDVLHAVFGSKYSNKKQWPPMSSDHSQP
jgi:hypothetical protein